MSSPGQFIRITIQIRGAEPIIVDNWSSHWNVGKSEKRLRDGHQFTGGYITLNGGPLDPDLTFAEQMTNIEGQNEFNFVHGEKDSNFMILFILISLGIGAHPHVPPGKNILLSFDLFFLSVFQPNQLHQVVLLSHKVKTLLN
jgi:hypothetical protein